MYELQKRFISPQYNACPPPSPIMKVWKGNTYILTISANQKFPGLASVILYIRVKGFDLIDDGTMNNGLTMKEWRTALLVLQILVCVQNTSTRLL
jgi:hypothetical protein